MLIHAHGTAALHEDSHRGSRISSRSRIVCSASSMRYRLSGSKPTFSASCPMEFAEFTHGHQDVGDIGSASADHFVAFRCVFAQFEHGTKNGDPASARRRQIVE